MKIQSIVEGDKLTKDEERMLARIDKDGKYIIRDAIRPYNTAGDLESRRMVKIELIELDDEDEGGPDMWYEVTRV